MPVSDVRLTENRQIAYIPGHTLPEACANTSRSDHRSSPSWVRSIQKPLQTQTDREDELMRMGRRRAWSCKQPRYVRGIGHDCKTQYQQIFLLLLCTLTLTDNAKKPNNEMKHSAVVLGTSFPSLSTFPNSRLSPPSSTCRTTRSAVRT